MSGRAASGRRWVKGGLYSFPLLAVALWLGTPLGVGDTAFTTLLVALLPALAVAQLHFVDAEESFPRIPVYLSSGAVILILGWMALLVGGRSLGVDAMGIGPAPWPRVVGWTLGLSGAAVLLLGAFLAARRRLGIRESRLLRLLLPVTATDKAVFAGLSLAAGMGEELAYRGYLLPTLVGLLGSEWSAALVSSLVFGILHAYQGWLGVARTAILGMLLAGSFLMAGTLWPAILAHAILDLVAGLVLGESLIRE